MTQTTLLVMDTDTLPQVWLAVSPLSQLVSLLVSSVTLVSVPTPSKRLSSSAWFLSWSLVRLSAFMAWSWPSSSLSEKAALCVLPPFALEPSERRDPKVRPSVGLSRLGDLSGTHTKTLNKKSSQLPIIFLRAYKQLLIYTLLISTHWYITSCINKGAYLYINTYYLKLF